MIRLIIDTSHKFLAVGVVDGNKILAQRQDMLSKQQSEYLITYIQEVIGDAKIEKSDIKEIILTDGPGSYTGLRIAMTFAKVFSLTNSIKIYTVNTLLSVSGLDQGFVLLDARGKRVFGAYVDKGQVIDEKVYQLDELELGDVKLFGDASLVDGEDNYGNIIQNILDVEAFWKEVKNIDVLTPRY